MNKRLGLMVAWLLVGLILLAHNAYLIIGKRVEPDTDIMALLPSQEQDPVLQQAFNQVVDSAQQHVIALVGSSNWSDTKQAADAFQRTIDSRPDLLKKSNPDTVGIQKEWLSLFFSNRLNLLTTQQRQELNNLPPEHWADIALGRLYSPFGMPKLGNWQDDPFGLFNSWVQARVQESPVRLRDGYLTITNGTRYFVVIPLTLHPSALSIEAQNAVTPLLGKARSAASKISKDAEILTAGVILHAAAASKQAQHEVSIIGVGSIIGVFLLIWFTFRSFRPILLISLSIGIGCLGGLSICWVLFDRIHIFTLVFGASLIGIAQDFGIYFLCNRADADANTDSWKLLERLLPGMCLSFATTVVGFLFLALTPFPGLKQMAVFSTCGLTFAWLTVICCFPNMANAKSFSKGTRWNWYKKSVYSWPQSGLNKRTILSAMFFACLTLYGLLQLTANDDIRLLQKPQKTLIEEQSRISELLESPEPTRFYLVRGGSPEVVLQREETLKSKLEPLLKQNVFSGYQAISDWVPSIRSQKENRDLITGKLLSKRGPLALLGKTIGEDDSWAQGRRKSLMNLTNFLSVDHFLKTSAGKGLNHLWLGKLDEGYASVIALRGLTSDNLDIFKGIPHEIEGVQWADKVEEISTVLGRYRLYMGGGILISYIAVFLVLFPRYRNATWRVVLPTALAGVGTFALLGIAGENIQLFNMLALLLILGIGIDYGIFLHENASDNERTVWLEIGLSAVSTLLSFGLLSLSETPALHSFGITVSIGLLLVWLSTPLFRIGGKNAYIKSK